MTEDPITIVYNGNLLFAHPNGQLSAVGSEWHSCPRLIDDKPCPRKGRDIMPEQYDPKNPKCRKCVYSATMHLPNQKQALKIAKLIYPKGEIIK